MALQPFGLAGVILGLIVLIVAIVFFSKNASNRNAIRIAALVIGLFAILAILLLRPQLFPPQGSPSVGPTVPIAGSGATVTTPTPLPHKGSSMIDVRGSVIPISMHPAKISILGTPGEWPIDESGNFSFRIPDRPRDVTIVVTYGDHSVQRGFYMLSEEPLIISLK